MDRVGGYASYLALTQDARAYELVTVAMKGERDAARLQKLQGERGRRK